MNAISEHRIAIVRYNRNPGDRLTRRQMQNLKQLAQIKDEAIDFSEIPELTGEWFARAVRGKFYRPAKEIASIHLDILRAAMQGAVSTKRKGRR